MNEQQKQDQVDQRDKQSKCEACTFWSRQNVGAGARREFRDFGRCANYEASWVRLTWSYQRACIGFKPVK